MGPKVRFEAQILVVLCERCPGYWARSDIGQTKFGRRPQGYGVVGAVAWEWTNRPFSWTKIRAGRRQLSHRRSSERCHETENGIAHSQWPTCGSDRSWTNQFQFLQPAPLPKGIISYRFSGNSWSKPRARIVVGTLTPWDIRPARHRRTADGRAADPLKTDKAPGWLKGELRPPNHGPAPGLGQGW